MLEVTVQLTVEAFDKARTGPVYLAIPTESPVARVVVQEQDGKQITRRWFVATVETGVSQDGPARPVASSILNALDAVPGRQIVYVNHPHLCSHYPSPIGIQA